MTAQQISWRRNREREIERGSLDKGRC